MAPPAAHRSALYRRTVRADLIFAGSPEHLSPLSVATGGFHRTPDSDKVLNYGDDHEYLTVFSDVRVNLFELNWLQFCL